MPSAAAADRRRPRRARALGTALAGVLALTGCTQVVSGTGTYAPPGTGGDVVVEPCPAAVFDCVTLAVPADHFATDSPTWHVTFAVHRATATSRGVFVTATGGPGSSGIAVAADRLAQLPAEITEDYDVVFFDQRGIGASEPFRCDRTLAAEGGEPVDATSTVAERDAFAADAAEFAADCFTEAGVDPARAGAYATRQAVEDLESFREWLDADQLTLYGESYGTQFQQLYAAAHPDRVAALVLDGVVDLGTDDLDFWLESTRAYNDVLAGTLVGCDAVAVCAADAPGSAIAQYDALAAQLAGAAEAYEFPLADGTAEQRELTLEELQAAAASSMSDPWSRAQFQSALNAAVEGNDVPLARLAAVGAGADAETGAVWDDPTFSGALYYAVQCADYDVVPDGSTGRAQLDVWLAAAGTAAVDQQRLGGLFYQDLPCLFWPETGATPVPSAPVTDQPYPLLALTADTDPNTPTQQAQRVFARTAGDAAIVVAQGGPHVVYGRGDACVDQAVESLLATGRLASTGLTLCPGAGPGDYYWPNAPTSATGYTDAWSTLDDLLNATLGNVTYAWWDGYGEVLIGCDAGGTARYDLAGDTLQVTLDACEWTPDTPVDGSFTVADGGSGAAAGSLELPFAELDFDDEAGEVTGTFRGAPVG